MTKKKESWMNRDNRWLNSDILFLFLGIWIVSFMAGSMFESVRSVPEQNFDLAMDIVAEEWCQEQTYEWEENEFHPPNMVHTTYFYSNFTTGIWLEDEEKIICTNFDEIHYDEYGWHFLKDSYWCSGGSHNNFHSTLYNCAKNTEQYDNIEESIFSLSEVFG